MKEKNAFLFLFYKSFMFELFVICNELILNQVLNFKGSYKVSNFYKLYVCYISCILRYDIICIGKCIPIKCILFKKKLLNK